VALYLALCSMQFAMSKLQLFPVALSRIAGSFDSYAGLTIAGAWLSLVLELRWRSETDWIGWAGRIVGIGWIGVFLLGWLRVAF
jgi:hypothetical protein